MSVTHIFLVLALLLPVVASAQEPNDLRQFRVGMPVSALPASGYGAFACVGDPSRKLSDWGGYRSCPVASDGSRALSFRYDDDGSLSNDTEGGRTEVGGQPVNLALLIDNTAQVTGIRITTDPHARLYLHKKAFLFARQVRARFGDDGWACTTTAPTPTEQPVGGVFIHEHCKKRTATRLFVLDSQLFHDPRKDLRDFIDATQLTILRAG